MKRNGGAHDGDVLILGKPLGTGIYSAALKKDRLAPEHYATFVDSATRLNTPGIALARDERVRALTDVTGFGLAGHLLEICRGAGLRAEVSLAALPLIASAAPFAQQGIVTGASGRNWAGYGKDVKLPAGFDAPDQALLTDPQTSGGLLVSCSPEVVGRVLDTFKRHGFDAAAEIGEVVAHGGAARLVVR